MHVSAPRPHRNGSILAFVLLLASTGAHAVCSLTSATEWCFEQGFAANTGGAEADDNLGAAVAAGDFNGDGHLDLAIGIPGENGGLGAGDGAVQILYGDGVFPRAAGSQLILGSSKQR